MEEKKIKVVIDTREAIDATKELDRALGSLVVKAVIAEPSEEPSGGEWRAVTGPRGEFKRMVRDASAYCGAGATIVETCLVVSRREATPDEAREQRVID